MNLNGGIHNQIPAINNVLSSATCTQTPLKPINTQLPLQIASTVLAPSSSLTNPTQTTTTIITTTQNYEGFANCITCGEYGVRAAFYGKSKLYCSVSCQSGLKKTQPVKRTFEVMSSNVTSNGLPSDTTIAKLSKNLTLKLNAVEASLHHQQQQQQQTASIAANTQVPHTNNIFIWTEYLENERAEAAPLSAFKHCPLNSLTQILKIDLKVEVPNREQHTLPGERGQEGEVNYWFASVIKFAGYYAKLRYLGYEENNSKNDFWTHICDSEVHPVGWSSENDVSLVPPRELIDKYDDWKQYLLDKISGCNTLPKNFHRLVKQSLKSPFRRGMLLELVDKKKLSRMKVSRIIDNIGGRLQMKYEHEEYDDFWCHQESELIHPIGWSTRVGHDLDASLDYIQKSRQKTHSYAQNECTPDLFKCRKTFAAKIGEDFKEKMKLEAIDPLNLSTICVATISKILKSGYLMIRIDGYDNSQDMFCYHRTSPSIFPPGFCQINNIPLQAPYDYKGDFSWEKYLRETNAEFAPTDLFYYEPKMICVATVASVVDRLIRLNFDGWDSEYDQWVDCESCDIYPVGWCHLVNYTLEPPRKSNYDGQHIKKKFKKLKRSSKSGK